MRNERIVHDFSLIKNNSAWYKRNLPKMHSDSLITVHRRYLPEKQERETHKASPPEN